MSFVLKIRNLSLRQVVFALNKEQTYFLLSTYSYPISPQFQIHEEAQSGKMLYYVEILLCMICPTTVYDMNVSCNRKQQDGVCVIFI